MAQIVAGANQTRTVIVERSRAVAAVTANASAVLVPRNAAQPVAVVDRTQVLNVASPGPQGQAGAPGGTSEPRIASEVLGGHRVVRSTGAGTVGYADATILLHGDDTVGLTLGAANAGEVVNVQRVGAVSFNGWAWSPGEPVFLGANGLPTQAPPEPVAGAAFVQPIGHAEDATTLYLHIDAPTYFED